MIWSEENGGKLPGQGTEAVDSDAFYEEDDLDILPEEDHTMTKMDYWERKILDMTLRNTLLSTSFKGKQLPVMGTMPQMAALTAGLQEADASESLKHRMNWH